MKILNNTPNLFMINSTLKISFVSSHQKWNSLINISHYFVFPFKFLDKYYELRGWTKNGVPTEKKLNELGLDFAMKDMK